MTTPQPRPRLSKVNVTRFAEETLLKLEFLAGEMQTKESTLLRRIVEETLNENIDPEKFEAFKRRKARGIAEPRLKINKRRWREGKSSRRASLTRALRSVTLNEENRETPKSAA